MYESAVASQGPFSHQIIYVVADDKDYFSVLDDELPKDFLKSEWENSKKSELFVYRRLSQFFKEHYPLTRLCRTKEDIADVIKEYNIESILIGSDALIQHKPLLYPL